MKNPEEIVKSNRLSIVKRGEDGFAAFVIHPAVKARSLSVICSWGGGWDGTTPTKTTRPNDVQ